ncbi:MAG TPA: permease prefix domain 1-containing protein, partial [Phycisphaerales bacterium]|nr:permease prefix domain 1-containing protein [Phycisphaerales bacterium]
MNALRLHSEEAQPTPGAGTPGDPVASWLDVLEKLLGGTAEENRGIRDELASHLRERVRDLTVSGMVEAEAVRTAIGELGDAAELSKRFQQARGTSKRRKVMQIALATAAVIALGAGGLAVRGSVQADKAQQEAAVAREHALTAKNEALTAFTAAVLAQEGSASTAASPVEHADVTRSLLEASVLPRRAALASVLATLAGDSVDGVEVSCGPTDTWQQFFDNAAKAAGKGSHTNFTSLDGTGIDGNSL